MKFSRFLVAAIVVGLAFGSSANAATVNSSTVGSLPTPSGSYSTSGTGAFGSIADTLSGSLNPNTQITILYTYTNLNPAYLIETATGSNGLGQAISSLVATDNGGAYTQLSNNHTSTSASLPILATANFSQNNGTVVFKNLSSTEAAGFSSVFNSIFLGNGGASILVSYNITNVPLPPALILFASGLIALAGFSMYKKASAQA